MTAAAGVPGVKITFPVPMPSLPALSTMLPRVKVSAAVAMFTLFPETQLIFPSVVVTAVRVCVPSFTTLVSRTAVELTLPLVVVMASSTLTSRPASITRLPLVAVIAALMTTSRKALNVKIVGAPDAVQVTGSLTNTSPFTPAVPLLLSKVTLVVTRLPLKAAPEMSPAAATVKSLGSINHIPE
ncbi:hypothetical protein [Rhodoferax lithotrophicus]|uniref:hypothetical protein n=1 Tax=Rhodoferax lithotrophicus TaxID=2798804 RepID=UPI001CC468F8|nr:hypothetical protein [Rhodoferax sp. MIZ03]